MVDLRGLTMRIVDVKSGQSSAPLSRFVSCNLGRDEIVPDLARKGPWRGTSPH